jgi:formyl-CoA transferase
VTVNLRLPEGQEIVRKLAAEADIVIENFRPGTLEKWGLGYDDLVKVNKGVILMRVSGFGQTGPMRDLAGFGTVAESMGGMRYVSGFPDRPPVRMNLSIGDAIASLHGVIGVLMCLHHKNKTGEGQVVDVALYESVFNMMESTLPEYGLTGQVRERTGSNLTGIVPSNTYTSKDGVHIVIGGNGDSIFKRLMSTIGRDDLGDQADHGQPHVPTIDRRVGARHPPPEQKAVGPIAPAPPSASHRSSASVGARALSTAARLPSCSSAPQSGPPYSPASPARRGYARPGPAPRH